LGGIHVGLGKAVGNGFESKGREAVERVGTSGFEKAFVVELSVNKSDMKASVVEDFGHLEHGVYVALSWEGASLLWPWNPYFCFALDRHTTTLKMGWWIVFMIELAFFYRARTRWEHLSIPRIRQLKCFSINIIYNNSQLIDRRDGQLRLQLIAPNCEFCQPLPTS
jgi:hypothetical protein